MTMVSDYSLTREILVVNDKWSEQEFLDVTMRLGNYSYRINIKSMDLEDLKGSLAGKRDFLVQLLENPVLFEHEACTDLLWAVFHLNEELTCREDVKKLPDSDYEHLAGDIRRAYTLLVRQWLDYMRHLKDSYPYLFSLAMRMNPFDQNASPIVE